MDDVQETRSKRPYLVLAGLMALILLFLWGVWVSAHVLEPKPPRLVKVQLADSISRFVEAEARRDDASGEALQARTRAYLAAAEAAVRDMGQDGRIVLVSEAVLAGRVDDRTKELENRIARELAGEGQNAQ